tara:strand:+ start:921 stop:1202 length:282 start_codon:yes stop_codon:yes gene_type:complete
MGNGKDSTEWKASKLGIIASIALPAIATALEALQSGGHVENPLLAAAISAALSVLTALGYGAFRTALKVKQVSLERDKLKAAAIAGVDALEKK